MEVGDKVLLRYGSEYRVGELKRLTPLYAWVAQHTDRTGKGYRVERTRLLPFDETIWKEIQVLQKQRDDLLAQRGIEIREISKQITAVTARLPHA